MTIDTWVSLGALAGVLVTLGGLVLAQGRSLRSELKGDIAALDRKVDGVRDELKGDIAGLERKVDGLRDELRGDIGRLDDRVYALAAGLRPRVEEAQGPTTSG